MPPSLFRNSYAVGTIFSNKENQEEKLFDLLKYLIAMPRKQKTGCPAMIPTNVSPGVVATLPRYQVVIELLIQTRPGPGGLS